MLPKDLCGASGSSTAMFADRVRIPEKILKSIIGVFPVAMSTIMVSPTARPKPIIKAEKIPAEAVGSTTRMAVCQRLAPRAREPDFRSGGTLDRASSVMVKTIGITAKPIMNPTTRELRCSKAQTRHRGPP
jgi:hypothetical protein